MEFENIDALMRHLYLVFVGRVVVLWQLPLRFLVPVRSPPWLCVCDSLLSMRDKLSGVYEIRFGMPKNNNKYFRNIPSNNFKCNKNL